MAKYLVEPVIGGGQITTTTIPLATAVAPGTQYWDSTIGTGVVLISDGANWNQYSSIRPLIQTGFPMIVPSSGTLSAAGALSGITALATTYANCFMFFPANAVATVSVAGMYFVQMSSTTAGTVFQNTYTSGVPPIPSTLIPCTTASNYTQTTGSGLTILAVTVPGNTLGINGGITVHESVWSYNNSAGAKVMVVKYGANNIQNASGTTTTTLFTSPHMMMNRGATNSQVSLAGTVVTGFASGALVYGSVDSTVDVTFSATINLAVATDTCALEFISATTFPGA